MGGAVAFHDRALPEAAHLVQKVLIAVKAFREVAQLAKGLLAAKRVLMKEAQRPLEPAKSPVLLKYSHKVQRV